VVVLLQVLFHGSPESVEHLKEYCADTRTVCNSVYTPDDNETLDLTSDTNIYRVRTPDAR
jgi:hypothetical protein